MSIARRLSELRSRIDAACVRSGRAAGSARLLAVSKRQPTDAIEEAYAAGQRDFGENYVQELLEKRERLAHLTGLRWHLIGGLQTKKVRQLASGEIASFHALDSAKLAEEIARRASVAWRVFIQVNLDGEASKGGVAPGDVVALAAAVRAHPGKLSLEGLMCIPEPKASAEAMRPAFKELAALARGLEGGQTLALSMGMSQDFEVAVEEGASWLRVGTALFGERATQ